MEMNGAEDTLEFTDRLARIEAERFFAGEYRGPADAPAFEVVSGKIPVIVSAPHAVTHLRDGNIKPSDDFTGALALAIAHGTGCHAIVATRFDNCDPNWDPFEQSAYKQAIARQVCENGIRLLLDIHGVPTASPYAIEIGSSDGATVAAAPGLDNLARHLFEHELDPYLARYDKTVALNQKNAARRPGTVANAIARECGIPTLQLEICTRFRVPCDLGGHVPPGEKMPFKPEQLSAELSARRNPDAACVVATMRAICSLIDESLRLIPGSIA